VSKKKCIKAFKEHWKRLVQNYYNSIGSLGGSGMIVESMNQSLVKIYNRGHPVKGVWVFGVVEISQSRKILLIPIIKRDSDSILSILKKYVLNDTIIYSDSWKEYSKLKDY
ncbi:hypothetical protein H311_05052, partial [Anncaliia algerae PRA109]